MSISIRFTYNITTPESSADGDYADSGFCDERGWPITDRSCPTEMIRDTQVELWEEVGDLEHLIRQAVNLGIYEPNCRPEDIGSTTWFSSVDGNINYRTGAETHYSLHIDGLTDSEMIEIHLMLCNGYLSDHNEIWLENIEERLIESNSR